MVQLFLRIQVVQPPAAGSKAELSKRLSGERKDPAAALADAIRKVSSSGSGLDEALKSEKELERRSSRDNEAEESRDNRAASFTQPSKKPQGHHRQAYRSSCRLVEAALSEQVDKVFPGDFIDSIV